MKKIIVSVAVAAICLSLLTGSAFAMDTKELVNKVMEASGGRDLITGTKTITANGKALAQGMEFPFIMYQARPGKMRLEVDIMGMKMIQAFDGETAWTINPMAGITEAQAMGENETKGMKLQADMDGVLVDWKDKGYEVEYVGEADVEGTPCFQLHVDTGMDIVQEIYVDQEFLLAIKVTSTVVVGEETFVQDTFMSDFQEMDDGRVVPFAIETRMGGTTANQIVMESMEFDKDLSGIEFEMPSTTTEEAAGQ